MNKIELNIPWKRYALITKLASSLQSTPNPQFGKTALQKMVYLFQAIYKVNCGYNFELYTYGPFTSQLLHDLDVTEHMGGVEVCRVDASNGGYKIVPGKKADVIIKKGENFLNDPEIKTKFSQLIANFGKYGAAGLELRSTIVYVMHDFQGRGFQPDTEEIVQMVEEIKPKFSSDEIRYAAAELIDIITGPINLKFPH